MSLRAKLRDKGAQGRRELLAGLMLVLFPDDATARESLEQRGGLKPILGLMASNDPDLMVFSLAVMRVLGKDTEEVRGAIEVGKGDWDAEVRKEADAAERAIRH